MTNADIAAKLVLGNRNADYGNPGPDFAGIAHIWTGLLNTRLTAPITATDVALMMTGLKLRRHAHKPKDDNLIDAHGYLTCLEWIERDQRPIPHAEEVSAALESVCVGEKLICPHCNRHEPCGCET